MPSERVQRQVNLLLDDIETARATGDWAAVRERAEEILDLDPGNEDARTFLAAAERRLERLERSDQALAPSPTRPVAPSISERPLPESFVSGRYRVQRFLGEGGRKRVFLAHDTRLDREVAFCSIRSDGLDLIGRQRVLREAQSMGRLGAHPHLVTIHDIGEEDGNPYIVEEFMSGGDVAGLLAHASAGSEQGAPLSRDSGRGAGGEGLPLERTLQLAKDVCRGLAFIHQAGMIHRDLKPGNVFITADGTAKIGDFGLAVSLDRSRLTQHGMMLGTVSYMPPEQALGGEATLKADLYSLGAMLYEMVTGRPPFVGDDPTAVISQHINTPPVAPSWLTEHCPPALEELILHLLAKDPGQRPESATAALAVLATVDATQKSATHSDSNVLDRLARGVFVGREKELDRLRKAFDEAFAGRGGLVMLVGEPGIGKTRTTQELETYARMRGANALWGRAHESSGAPPYWPFIQVVNGYAASNDIAAIGPDLPPGAAAELSRLFPWLRDQPNVGTPEPIGDPAAAQFRLFDAYASTIRAIASRTPLLVVLDDLHWSDKPTLLLLQHLAREMNRLRVLVVCTYRDTDLSRAHPLSEALATLNREAGFLRIPLRGLSRAEVDGYIRAAANVSPPARVVDKIFEETEGNPFFLSEVVNLMTQEGTLSRDSVSDIAVPDGVREALGRRLDRISEEANELLQVCAVAGREFTYDTLTLLDERSEDHVLRLIEEAVEARVIEEMEQPGRYRFTHALMQETLLDELTTTRRVRLHGQVGEALEKRWGPRADERAPRLAEHFVEAGMLAPRFAAKAVRYGKLAAQQAESQTAWDEAANWYERAVSLVSASDDGLGEDEAQLLVALGMCQRNAGNNRAAWRNLMRAATMFRERGDHLALARATAEAVWIPSAPARRLALIDESLELLGGADPHLEARLLYVRWSSDAPGDEADLKRIEEIVRQHGFPDIQATVLEAKGFLAMANLDLANALELFAMACDQFLALAMPIEATMSIIWLGVIPFFAGDMEPGEASAREQLAVARRVHAVFARSNIELRLAGLALAKGDWKAFEGLQADLADMVGNYSLDLQASARAELEGDMTRAVALLPAPELAGGFPSFVAHLHAGRARVRLLAGDEDGARAELAQWKQGMAGVTEQRFSQGRFFSLTELGEALPALADEAAARAAYAELVRCAPIRWDPIATRGADAIRGALALRLGLVDEAEAHFNTGLEWSRKWGLSVEQARNLEGLASVALRRGNTAEATGLLDQAAALYQQQGAKLYLSRIIARKVELQGLTTHDLRTSIDRVATAVATEHPDFRSHAAPDGTVTLLFSDIEGSTPLNEKLGDAKWMELLRAHNTLIRKHLKAHGGFEVKSMGDGFMLAFASARRALECAIAIQAEFGASEPMQRPETAAATPIRVRIGLHTGEAVKEGNDFFGKDVNLAARIGAQAHGGEILVSALLHDLLAASGAFTFDDAREIPLKGLTGTHRVYRVLLPR